MSDSSFGSAGYRAQIAADITPVRPLPSPARRAWMLVPIGLLLATASPLVNGQRGDIYGPLYTWGASMLQATIGLWILALGFRESVPGRSVSWRSLTLASALAVVLIVGITLATNGLSATFVPAGRGWEYWAECVFGPMALGAPFMILATLLTARAFPTRPAVAGALCGLSAGILTDAGWRLSCWISEPSHIVSSHALAIVGLAAAGAALAVFADARRWRSSFRNTKHTGTPPTRA